MFPLKHTISLGYIYFIYQLFVYNPKYQKYQKKHLWCFSGLLMQNNKPKIAIVHDYIKEWGGAELVLETLADLFPDAELFTSVYLPSFLGPHRERLAKKWQGRVKQSFFAKIPFVSRLISPLRLLSPLAFLQWDLKAYDLVIVSATGAYFPNLLRTKKGGKGALHLCYCHTPPRYLYGLATARNMRRYPLLNMFAQFANHSLRLLDFQAAQKVDLFVANSQTTAGRINKYYRRDSVVINPPVPLANEPYTPRSRENFYLTGGRLARAKRYDLAIMACTKLGLPLLVFGRDFAGCEKELQKLAGPTIKFLGEVTNTEKKRLFATCKAYLFPSDNEDFGIVSIEAQSQGAPVVAYGVGGGGETVIEGQTGALFHEMTVEALLAAIKRLDTYTIKPESCRQNALRYTPEAFCQKILDLVKNKIA